MQAYGFGNQRSGVFARLQVRLWVMSSAAVHPSFITYLIRMTRPIWWITFQTAPTGGAERCDWCQKPRGDDGGREEAEPTGCREICLFFWPLPVSLGPERSFLKRGSTDPSPLSADRCLLKCAVAGLTCLRTRRSKGCWSSFLGGQSWSPPPSRREKLVSSSCFLPIIHPIFVCNKYFSRSFPVKIQIICKSTV